MARYFRLSDGRKVTAQDDAAVKNLLKWGQDNGVGLSEVYHYRTPDGKDWTVEAWAKDEELKKPHLRGAINVGEQESEAATRNKLYGGGVKPRNPLTKPNMNVIAESESTQLGGTYKPPPTPKESFEQLSPRAQSAIKQRDAIVQEMEDLAVARPPAGRPDLLEDWEAQYETRLNKLNFLQDTIIPYRVTGLNAAQRELADSAAKWADKYPALAATVGELGMGLWGAVTSPYNFITAGMGRANEAYYGIRQGIGQGLADEGTWNDVGSGFYSFGLVAPLTIGTIMSGGASAPVWANAMAAAGTATMQMSITSDIMRELYQNDNYLSFREAGAAALSGGVQQLTENLSLSFQTKALTNAFKIGGQAGLRTAASELVRKAVAPTIAETTVGVFQTFGTEILEENLQWAEDAVIQNVMLGKPMPTWEETKQAVRDNTIGALFGVVLQSGGIMGVQAIQSKTSAQALAKLAAPESGWTSPALAQQAIDQLKAGSITEAVTTAQKAHQALIQDDPAMDDKAKRHVLRAISNVYDAGNMFDAQTAANVFIEEKAAKKELAALEQEKRKLEKAIPSQQTEDKLFLLNEKIEEADAELVRLQGVITENAQQKEIYNLLVEGSQAEQKARKAGDKAVDKLQKTKEYKEATPEQQRQMMKDAVLSDKKSAKLQEKADQKYRDAALYKLRQTSEYKQAAPEVQTQMEEAELQRQQEARDADIKAAEQRAISEQQEAEKSPQTQPTEATDDNEIVPDIIDQLEAKKAALRQERQDINKELNEYRKLMDQQGGWLPSVTPEQKKAYHEVKKRQKEVNRKLNEVGIEIRKEKAARKKAEREAQKPKKKVDKKDTKKDTAESEDKDGQKDKERVSSDQRQDTKSDEQQLDDRGESAGTGQADRQGGQDEGGEAGAEEKPKQRKTYVKTKSGGKTRVFEATRIEGEWIYYTNERGTESRTKRNPRTQTTNDPLVYRKWKSEHANRSRGAQRAAQKRDRRLTMSQKVLDSMPNLAALQGRVFPPGEAGDLKNVFIPGYGPLCRESKNDQEWTYDTIYENSIPTPEGAQASRDADYKPILEAAEKELDRWYDGRQTQDTDYWDEAQKAQEEIEYYEKELDKATTEEERQLIRQKLTELDGRVFDDYTEAEQMEMEEAESDGVELNDQGYPASWDETTADTETNTQENTTEKEVLALVDELKEIDKEDKRRWRAYKKSKGSVKYEDQDLEQKRREIARKLRLLDTKLVRIEWRSKLEEVPDRLEGSKVKRVSDWDKSDVSELSNRNIVHVYWIEIGGETKPYGIDTASKILGIKKTDLAYKAKAALVKQREAEREERRRKKQEEQTDTRTKSEALQETLPTIPDKTADDALLGMVKSHILSITRKDRTTTVNFRDGRQLVINHITQEAMMTEAGRTGVMYAGRTQGEKGKNVYTAIVDLVDGLNQGNRTLFHESFHVVWKLFLNSEQISYINQYYRAKANKGELVRKYVVTRQGTEMALYWTKEQFNALNRERQAEALEEGAAYGFEHWLGSRTDTAPTTMIGKLWQRLADAIRHALVKLNLANQNAKLTDIFHAVASDKLTGQGEQGAETRNMVANAYHGGPHAFDKFDENFVGTGEGNAAFGWGAAYASESRGVGEYYSRMGEPPRTVVKYAGKTYDNKRTESLKQYFDKQQEREGVNSKYEQNDAWWMKYILAYDSVSLSKLGVDGYIKELRDDIERHKYYYTENSYQAKNTTHKLSAIEKYKDSVEFEQTEGNRNLYQVDLWPDRQEDVLEWEKKTKPEHIKKILAQAKKESIDIDYQRNDLYIKDPKTGWHTTTALYNKDLYRGLSEALGSAKAASKFLLRAGIDGIKYPVNALSGGKGEKGYNYVVFDADQIQIKEHTRYKPVPTAAEVAEAERQYAEVEAKYRGTDGWLKAPNGKPTNLNERQWVQVRTQAFKDWFGDWENDPKNASKVVDENGEPKPVWHGSMEYGFNEFHNGSRHYFTDNGIVAEEYSGYYEDKIYDVFLNLRNPVIADAGGKRYTDKTFSRAEREADENGHDGAIISNVDDAKYLLKDSTAKIGTTYIATSKLQIKSATANVGTFDQSNPDIRYKALSKEDVSNLSAYTVQKFSEEIPYATVSLSKSDTRVGRSHYIKFSISNGIKFMRGEIRISDHGVGTYRHFEHIHAWSESDIDEIIDSIKAKTAEIINRETTVTDRWSHTKSGKTVNIDDFDQIVERSDGDYTARRKRDNAIMRLRKGEQTVYTDTMTRYKLLPEDSENPDIRYRKLNDRERALRDEVWAEIMGRPQKLRAETKPRAQTEPPERGQERKTEPPRPQPTRPSQSNPPTEAEIDVLSERIGKDLGIAPAQVKEKLGRQMMAAWREAQGDVSRLMESAAIRNFEEWVENNKPEGTDKKDLVWHWEEMLEYAAKVGLSREQIAQMVKSDRFDATAIGINLFQRMNYIGKLLVETEATLSDRNWGTPAEREQMEAQYGILQAQFDELQAAYAMQGSEAGTVLWTRRQNKAQYLENLTRAAQALESKINRGAVELGEMRQELDGLERTISDLEKSFEMLLRVMDGKRYKDITEMNDAELEAERQKQAEQLNDLRNRAEHLKYAIEQKVAAMQADKGRQEETQTQIRKIRKTGRKAKVIEIKERKPDVHDWIRAAWYNSVLAGAPTHMINMSANVVNSLLEDVATLFTQGGRVAGAQFAEKVRALFSNYEQLDPKTGEKIKTGAFAKAKEEFTSPQEFSKKNEVILKGNKFFRGIQFSTKFLGAEDMLAFFPNERGMLKSLAFDESKRTGRSVADLMENPTADMLRQAYYEAKRNTFNQNPEQYVGVLIDTINKFYGALDQSGGGGKAIGNLIRFNVLPFTRVLGNVLNATIDYTPLGMIRYFAYKSDNPNSLLNRQRKDQNGRPLWLDENGDQMVSPFRMRDARRQAARVALGTILGSLLYFLAMSADDDDDDKWFISGAGPQNYKKYKQLMAAGWRPYSIHIGNAIVSYKEWPVSGAFAVVGNLHDIQKYDGKTRPQDWMDKTIYATMGVASSFLDRSFASNAISTATAFDRNDPKWVKRSLTSTTSSTIIPYNNMLRFIENTYNRNLYTPETIAQQAWASVPLVPKKGLPRRVNVFGMYERKDPATARLAMTDNVGLVVPDTQNTQKIFRTVRKNNLFLSETTKRELRVDPYVGERGIPEEDKQHIWLQGKDHENFRVMRGTEYVRLLNESENYNLIMKYDKDKDKDEMAALLTSLGRKATAYATEETLKAYQRGELKHKYKTYNKSKEEE